MDKRLQKAIEDDRRRGALTPKQIDFLDKLHVAARIVATPHLTKRGMVDTLMDAYPGTDEAEGMSEPEARLWIRRAREYIATGAPADLPDLKADYVAKLDWFIALLSKHVVKDQVEVVATSQAVPVKADQSGAEADAETKDAGRIRTIKRKVRADAFNPAIAATLLKALREYGEVTGARPKNGPKSVTVHNTQNNVVMPGRSTSELGNDALMRILDGRARVLPEPRPGADAAGVPQAAGGAAEGDHAPAG